MPMPLPMLPTPRDHAHAGPATAPGAAPPRHGAPPQAPTALRLAPPVAAHVLAQIGGMTTLTRLDLSHRLLPCGALASLAAGLPRLRALCLRGAEVGADEVAALERSNPGVSIAWRAAASGAGGGQGSDGDCGGHGVLGAVNFA